MQITNERAIKIAHSIERFQNEYEGIALLFKPKIRAFLNNNGVRFQAVMERAELIDKKYYEADTENEGQWKLIEGMKEEDYKAEAEAFLKEEFRLIV